MTELQLLTPTTVASMLGINRVTVLQWAKLGIMPSPKIINGNYRFLKSEIEAFVATGMDNAFRPKPVKEKFVNEDGETVEGVGYYDKAVFPDWKKNQTSPYEAFKDAQLDQPSGTGKSELPPDSTPVPQAALSVKKVITKKGK